MTSALKVSAVAEAATGLGLLIAPSLVAHLLLGQELTGLAIVVARVTGIALIGLAVACWPGPPVAGMLTYSALVALCLGYAGIVDGFRGLLLWPAIVLHVILAILLGRTWLTDSSRLVNATGG